MPDIPHSAYGAEAGERTTVWAPRCWQCGSRMAEYLTPPFSLRCKRCKAQNRVGAIILAATS